MRIPGTCAHLLGGLLAAALLAACAGRGPDGAALRPPWIGFSVQVGAFTVFDNAVRLTRTLQRHGQPATFFKDDDGLYKVRFGDFKTGEAALRQAGALKTAGVIEAFFVVAPATHRQAEQGPVTEERSLRERIVHTARGFIGLPYRWGGTSPQKGFDCSGLTMTAYRVNGIELPRTSSAQFRSGRPVDRRHLEKGDLVFFSLQNDSATSHVGIYAGEGRFIHAPGRGRTIRTSKLDNVYYRHRFRGARSYF